ncbi:MAG TPA: EsaB/YukD family protein [Ktedonobacterales bacterium]|nr:EsaB/YukD family protein [Ktedonobacterales bacterium]
MRTVLVTITGPEREVDCEIPGDAPISELLPLLMDACGLDTPASGGSSSSALTATWALGLESGPLFPMDKSLIACGVVDGARLLLRSRESRRMEAPPLAAAHAAPDEVLPSPATGGIGVHWNREGLL